MDRDQISLCGLVLSAICFANEHMLLNRLVASSLSLRVLAAAAVAWSVAWDGGTGLFVCGTADKSSSVSSTTTRTTSSVQGTGAELLCCYPEPASPMVSSLSNSVSICQCTFTYGATSASAREDCCGGLPPANLQRICQHGSMWHTA